MTRVRIPLTAFFYNNENQFLGVLSETIMKPAVRKIAMERMQILIENAITNAKQILNFLSVKLYLLVELVVDIKFECLMISGWFFVKNASPLLRLELILESV